MSQEIKRFPLQTLPLPDNINLATKSVLKERPDNKYRTTDNLHQLDSQYSKKKQITNTLRNHRTTDNLDKLGLRQNSFQDAAFERAVELRDGGRIWLAQ